MNDIIITMDDIACKIEEQDIHIIDKIIYFH